MTAPALPVFGNPAASVEHCLAPALDYEAKALKMKVNGHAMAETVMGWANRQLKIAEDISTHYGV